jgi:hypothetical protein
MKYEKQDRHAINGLSSQARMLFEVCETFEKGEILGLPELCSSLSSGTATMMAFSCISGSAEGHEIGQDMGALFGKRKRKETEAFLGTLAAVGRQQCFLVVLDDCEPRRVWQWEISQEEVTDWCRMVVEDAEGQNQIPPGWEIKLWSDIEKSCAVEYDRVLAEICAPRFALIVHQHIEHMKRFPNKKLAGDIRQAAVRRVAQYALQGAVLEESFPHAILLQSETPWGVKDPLYGALRRKPLPIIHPYPEERR